MDSFPFAAVHNLFSDAFSVDIRLASVLFVTLVDALALGGAGIYPGSALEKVVAILYYP